MLENKIRTVYTITELFFLSILLIIINFSCDSPTGPLESSEISFIESGGFTGGIHIKLVIDKYGIASLESQYPVLKQTLSGKEFNSLLKLFSGFANLNDSYYGGCADIPVFNITYKNGRINKTVNIDGCALLDSLNPDVAKLKAIINLCANLAAEIYNNQAPWAGLTAEYITDKEICNLGSSLKMTFILRNPTDKKRSLYFRNGEQIIYNIYQREYPYKYYRYPYGTAVDSTPSVITLEPGEEKTFDLMWDQKMFDSKGRITTAAAGSYNLFMAFGGAVMPGQQKIIYVVDPAVPVLGQVIADPIGENKDAGNYNFNLSVKNWTTNSVTLDFLNSQKILIELYDINNPLNNVLIYRSAEITDNNPAQTEIPAGGVTNFSDTFSKDSLNLSGGYWYHVRIKLLCSGFNLESESDIVIYK